MRVAGCYQFYGLHLQALDVVGDLIDEGRQPKVSMLLLLSRLGSKAFAKPISQSKEPGKMLPSEETNVFGMEVHRRCRYLGISFMNPLGN